MEPINQNNLSNKIIEYLENKKKNPICNYCKEKKFTLQRGFFIQIIHDDIKVFKLSGYNIPSIMIMCENCGAITQFAALHFLSKEEIGSADIAKKEILERNYTPKIGLFQKIKGFLKCFLL